MIDQEYNSRYAIGQIIQQDNKYWQITSFQPPKTGDTFVSNALKTTISVLPSWVNFDSNDKRYIVTEVNVTPVKAPKEVSKKLDKGTVIIHENVFYEVTDYRTPQLDEFYAYRFADSSCVVYQRLFPNLLGSEASFNVVKKIEPYRKGQVINFNGKSYIVVDYNFPNKNQVFLNNADESEIAEWNWTTVKTFILEPIAPEPVDDPEANAYKPGQLIVRENLVYRVIEYRKPAFDDRYTHSSFSAVHYASKGITKPYWVVEAYCVK